MPEAVPDGDVLIHCGDMSNVGKARELKLVNEWLGSLPHKTKIAIAGNHDVGLDIKQYDELWKRFHASNKEDPVENRKIMSSVTMLYDEAITLDCGLKIYGSPYSPEFCNWAFSLKTTQDKIDCWSKIPDDTDILITHGPPFGILDECAGSGFNAGDEVLLEEV